MNPSTFSLTHPAMDTLLMRLRRCMGWLLLAASASALAQGQEMVIRKNLSERVPQLPKIEEVTRSPMPGLYELRLSTNEIYYSDAEGNFLINGQLIDTKNKRNLTEEREAKLSAIDFATQRCHHHRTRQRQAQTRGV